MPQKTEILAVAGARPNFMKVAPLLRALEASETLTPFLVHTGQHYDAAMSDQFFEDLGIRRPDVNLAVGSGSHAQQTAEVLSRIEPVLLEREPGAVVVVGDVNSTIAAALAAVKLQIPVAHVEAGLRSRDRAMPEEINRILTDSISHWLFTTEPDGEKNLLAEGVVADRIHFVGNVMIDTLLQNLDRARGLDTLERLGLTPNGYGVLTLHRPSNVDDPERLARLFALLEELHQELPIVFPIHPRTRASIASRLGGRNPVLELIEPQGYLDFLRLMADARVVLTDSGGIQEETTVLGTPCITLRDNTERPVTVTQGTNVLTGADPEKIRAAFDQVMAGERGDGRVPEKWDGQAASRIVEILERDL